MTPQDVAWFAGLFEGEGYISIARGRHVYVGINMCDLDVLQKVREVTGRGYIKERKVYKDHHRRSYTWKVTRYFEAIELLIAIRPHMGARRKARIAEALAVDGPTFSRGKKQVESL